MLAGALVTVAFMVIAKFWDTGKMLVQRPEPTITLHMLKPGNLNVDILGGEKGKGIISLLNTKFDIPGRESRWEVEQRGCDSVNISSDMLAAINDVRTAETIVINARDLMPGGFCRIKIQYEPTETGTLHIPWLDLHTISRIDYVWRFDGTDKLETRYLDLSEMSYIKEDQEALAQSPLFKDIVAVKAMNQKRRDW